MTELQEFKLCFETQQDTNLFIYIHKGQKGVITVKVKGRWYL